jgi:hybrid cluster-associated redox disulfide protein
MKKVQSRSKAKLIKVEKSANLGDVLKNYPLVAEVLIDYGLHCIGCVASAYDTIEQGAKIHGLSDTEIDEMMERVNEVINFKED